MQNIKRIYALVLALVMVLSLAACGETTAPTDAPKATDGATEAPKATDGATEAPTEAEPFDAKKICEGVTLTVAVPEDDEVTDWNTNLVTLMVEERLGVNLEFVTYASADYYDKINVMVNGGDKLPDIIMSDSSTTGISQVNWSNWANQEAIIPLNEYYADPNFAYYNNWASDYVGYDIPSLAADADGNIWGAVKFVQFPTNEAPTKFWINMEYVEKLGMEKPKTVEDFYDICVAFKAAGDMNGDGQDNEVCFTGRGDNLQWFKFLMSSYAYAWDEYYLDVENGELSFAYTSEGWKEGLKMIKKFFDDGLISTTALTQDAASYNAISKDISARLLADTGYYPNMVAEKGHDQRLVRLKYDYVTAFESADGRTEARYIPTTAGVGAVITVDCENPEAAFLVLDLLCCEELSLCNRYGEQGVNWDYWKNADMDKRSSTTQPVEAYTGRHPELFPEPTFIAYNDGGYWGKGIPQNAGYMQAGPQIIVSDIYWGVATVTKDMLGTESSASSVAYNKLYRDSIVDALADAPAESVITLPMTGEESAKVTNIQLTLDNYVKESIGSFLTGEWDIDTYWDTYIAELDKIGMNTVLEIYQTSYDRTK